VDEQRILNYRNDPEPLGRWFVKRLILGFLIVVAFVIIEFVWKAAPSIDRYIGVYSVQSQCAKFEFPASTVSFELDPTLAPGIVAANPDAISMPYGSNVSQPAAGRTTPCWTAFVNKVGRGPNDPPGATVFCHALKDSRKRSYVVHIDVEILYQGSDPVVEFRPACLAVQSMLDGPICGGGRFAISSDEITAAIKTRNFRVLAGTIDPNDPTHVIIQLLMNGVARHVDGFMHPGGIFKMKPGDTSASLWETWSGQKSPW
jgi:hypothetical protein